MDKTIIRWQVVNTRKKNKNYPELDGSVKLPFENGFQWCYWEDIENVLNGIG